MEVPFCITTTPRCRSGLLHPPAASFADSWKAVRAWHQPRGGGNDERGKSPNPRTEFPSFLESANPALPTFPPHSYCCCPRVNTQSEPLRYSLPSRLTHRFLGGGKKPNDCGSKPMWQQPLYIVLKRDGTYSCGCCSLENNSLVVHTYPGGVHRRDQFRNRDAEVIGKIVAVVRKLI